MTAQSTLSASPSRLTVGIHPRGYLLAGATVGALLLSGLSNNAVVLALGGALGLFLLGELYAVTFRLREFITNIEVSIEPPPEAQPESEIRLSLRPETVALDMERVALTVTTSTTSNQQTLTPDRSEAGALRVPVSADDERLDITVVGHVDSPGGVCTAALTVVDASVPVDELLPAATTGSKAAFGREKRDPLDSEVSASGGEYDGLRQYVAGDPLAHIDWKATARQGTLHVREWATSQAEQQVILLDLPSLPHAAWQPGVDLCRERLEHGAIPIDSSVGVVLPSGDTEFHRRQGLRDVDAALEYVESVVENAVVTESVTPGEATDDLAPRPLQRRTRIGKLVTEFHRRGDMATNSLEGAIRQIHRRSGGTPAISVITGTQTPGRTVSGLRGTGRVSAPTEICLLSDPEGTDEVAALRSAIETATGATVTERPMHRGGAVHANSTQQPREYVLTRRVSGS